MKKMISWILFILSSCIFAFGAYFTIFGAIYVNEQYEQLAAEGRGGMEFMAVGDDIYFIGIVLISIVGAAVSVISSKIAQNRAVKVISYVTYCLFWLLPLTAFLSLFI